MIVYQLDASGWVSLSSSFGATTLIAYFSGYFDALLISQVTGATSRTGEENQSALTTPLIQNEETTEDMEDEDDETRRSNSDGKDEEDDNKTWCYYLLLPLKLLLQFIDQIFSLLCKSLGCVCGLVERIMIFWEEQEKGESAMEFKLYIVSILGYTLGSYWSFGFSKALRIGVFREIIDDKDVADAIASGVYAVIITFLILQLMSCISSRPASSNMSQFRTNRRILIVFALKLTIGWSWDDFIQSLLALSVIPFFSDLLYY